MEQQRFPGTVRPADQKPSVIRVQEVLGRSKSFEIAGSLCDAACPIA
jgi:hypothetical protein